MLHQNNDPTRKCKSKYITLLEYNRYRVRKNDFEQLHLGGRLSHEYLLDLFIRWEQSQMNYYKNNQKILKISSYESTRKFHEKKSNKKINKLVVIPESFPYYL